MKRRAYVLAAALALLVLAAIVVLSTSPEEDEEVGARDEEVEAPPPEDWGGEGLLGLDGEYVEEGPEKRSQTRGDSEGWSRARGWMGMRGFRRRVDGGAPDPGWEARRARRRERFLRRIEVIALGPEEPSTTDEEIFDAFRDVRPLVRDCLRNAGVDRGAWRQMRSTSRTLTFDIDAEGGVVPESMGFEPVLPAPFDECMHSSLEVLTVEPPGQDGARVSIEFPERRRRRRGDAGAR